MVQNKNKTPLAYRIVKPLFKSVHNIISPMRRNKLMDFIGEGKTVLDVGCRTPYLKEKVQQRGMEYKAVDISPSEGVEYGDIHKLSYKDKSFDYVICSEVLEHIKNPIKAMEELKRVTAKRLIVTVPNEPFFTLFRFLIWEQEHLWAITPPFKDVLGRACAGKDIFFKAVLPRGVGF